MLKNILQQSERWNRRCSFHPSGISQTECTDSLLHEEAQWGERRSKNVPRQLDALYRRLLNLSRSCGRRSEGTNKTSRSSNMKYSRFLKLQSGPKTRIYRSRRQVSVQIVRLPSRPKAKSSRFKLEEVLERDGGHRGIADNERATKLKIESNFCIAKLAIGIR